MAPFTARGQSGNYRTPGAEFRILYLWQTGKRMLWHLGTIIVGNASVHLSGRERGAKEVGSLNKKNGKQKAHQFPRRSWLRKTPQDEFNGKGGFLLGGGEDSG